MPEPKSVIVTLQESASATEVAATLKATGFLVENVLEFAGCITGNWDGDLAELQNITGVQAAELDGEQFAM